MKVTPLDLRQQRFATVMRGYDRAEVTAFLNEVADDYEHALREAERLREDVARLEAAVAEHHGQERNLRNTLLTAQKMADDVRDRAALEAERLVKEAESRVDLVVQQSQARIDDLQRDVESMRTRRREVEESIQALVTTLQGTLTFIREQDARGREDSVLLLHRPKQADPTPAPAPSEGVSNDRTAEG